MIEPRNAYGMECFISIRLKQLDRSHFSILASLRFFGVKVGHSILNARFKFHTTENNFYVIFQNLEISPIEHENSINLRKKIFAALERAE